MKLGNLESVDSSFRIVHGPPELNVEGITDNYQLLVGHFIFVKNKNFLNEWLEKTSSPKSIGLVVEKKFFESIDIEIKKTLEAKALFVATVDDVNLAMSFISKPFFDKKFKSHNDVVDGRQMGSATVDPSAWIAQGVFVGENVKIAANVKIHSGVVLMSGVEIEEETEIEKSYKKTGEKRKKKTKSKKTYHRKT